MIYLRYLKIIVISIDLKHGNASLVLIESQFVNMSQKNIVQLAK